MSNSNIIVSRVIIPHTAEEIKTLSSQPIQLAQKYKNITCSFAISMIVIMIIFWNCHTLPRPTNEEALKFTIIFMSMLFLVFPCSIFTYLYHHANQSTALFNYSPTNKINQRTIEAILKEPEMIEWTPYWRALQLMNRPIYQYEYEEMFNFWKESLKNKE